MKRALIALGFMATAAIAWPALATTTTTGLARTTYQAPWVSNPNAAQPIALTFDDGPSPYTPQILSILRRYHVPATFFEVGQNVQNHPDITKTVANAGYPVENHTWSHPMLTRLSPSDVSYQIDQTQAEIKAATGATPACLRPPYNDFNASVLNQIHQHGLTAMGYSVDPRDWSRPGTQAIVDRVMAGVGPGGVVLMHDGGGDRSETVAALPTIIQDLAARGYQFVSICGPISSPPAHAWLTDVYSYGTAGPAGSSLYSSRPIVGSAIDPATGGHWIVGSDGRLVSNGAPYLGSLAHTHLNAPVVGIAATPSGNGYFMASADGGVFPFGDAVYHGSLGSIRLNKPIVAIAATPSGRGYYLVASDGGVFQFGDAVYRGSLGAITLNSPIVGAAITPHGYFMVAADGGVFHFGDAAYHGSLGNVRLNKPVVSMAVDSRTGGYWLLAADGGVFYFDAAPLGTRGGVSAVDVFVAIDAAPRGTGYKLVAERPA